MNNLRSDFKIEDKGAGLRAVFKLKTAQAATEGEERVFDEGTLLERIRDVEGGGKSASLEKKALFDLQRQKQIKQKP